MHRFLTTAFAITTGIATMANSAAAQQKDPVAAEALFRDAREAFKKGDYATACPKFAESNRLDPATGTLFNLADCEERAGKIASSWQHWRDVVDALRTNPGDERHGIATQHVSALEPRLPRLRVKWAKGPVANATVKRDGVELGSMSMDAALPTDPGPHTIEVTANGRKPMSYTVQAIESKVTDVEVNAGDEIGGVVTKPEVTPDPNNQPHVTQQPQVDNNLVVPQRDSSGGGSSALPILGVITMVLGGGLVIAGIGTGAAALGAKGTVDMECNTNKLCSMKGADAAHQVSGLATASTVTFIIGGILVAGGLTLVIAGSGGGGKKSAKIPLWLQGRF